MRDRERKSRKKVALSIRGGISRRKSHSSDRNPQSQPVLKLEQFLKHYCFWLLFLPQIWKEIPQTSSF